MVNSTWEVMKALIPRKLGLATEAGTCLDPGIGVRVSKTKQNKNLGGECFRDSFFLKAITYKGILFLESNFSLETWYLRECILFKLGAYLYYC